MATNCNSGGPPLSLRNTGANCAELAPNSQVKSSDF